MKSLSAGPNAPVSASGLLLRGSLLLLTLAANASTAAERYQIDSTHTFSYFEYSHWGLSLQRSATISTTR